MEAPPLPSDNRRPTLLPHSPSRLHNLVALNSIPIEREIHAGPLRDHPLERRLFLDLARAAVMEAVGQREYELTENDRAFLALAEG
jgi:hypothetical protein